MTSKEFGKILQDKLTSEYGVELNVASNQQIYRSLALICRQMMSAPALPSTKSSSPRPSAPAPSRSTTSAWSF